jgi:hypothetical protein
MTLSALGIFSAAGAGGLVAAGDYELIATAFGTGSSDTITFSDIPQDYKHLQIRYMGRLASSGARLYLRMNGVSTSGNYRSHALFGTGTSVSSVDYTLGTAIDFQRGFDITTTNAFIGGIIDVLDYTSTSKNTTVRSLYGGLGNVNGVHLQSGVFLNTAAVTSLTITNNAAINITATSRFSLYGIRG